MPQFMQTAKLTTLNLIITDMPDDLMRQLYAISVAKNIPVADWILGLIVDSLAAYRPSLVAKKKRQRKQSRSVR